MSHPFLIRHRTYMIKAAERRLGFLTFEGDFQGDELNPRTGFPTQFAIEERLERHADGSEELATDELELLQEVSALVERHGRLTGGLCVECGKLSCRCGGL